MYTLVAATRKPILDGVVATRSFSTIEDAERTMQDWARFGVENSCNEADAIYSCDRTSRLIRIWDFARRQSVVPES